MDYTVTPLSEHTGAEVRGIDLAEPIDEGVRLRLNRAFIDHSVLVLRKPALPIDVVFAVPSMNQMPISPLSWRSMMSDLPSPL